MLKTPYVTLTSFCAALKSPSDDTKSPSVNLKSPLVALKSLLVEVKRPLFIRMGAKITVSAISTKHGTVIMVIQ